MPGSFKIGRILGIPVTINPSWFVLLLVLVFSLATQAFPQELRAQPRWLHWLLALVAALVLFASMIVHELAHSVAARAFGIPVRSITLFLLGAVAQTGRETRRPLHEFIIAIVGPVASILIAGVFMLLWFFTGQGGGAWSLLVAWLWLTNIAVGLFNLIPAFPMDGGRVLRAALWGLTRDYRRATRWAAIAGRTFAILLVTAGLLVVMQAPGPFSGFGPVSGVQFILLSLFLYFAAQQGDAQAGVIDALSRYRVRDIMIRDVPVVLASTSVRDALLGPLAGYGLNRDWLFISDGERFTGLTQRDALRKVAEDRWDAARVSEVMLPVSRIQAVRPDDDLGDVLQGMQADDLPVLAVVEDGQVAGLVHRGQLVDLLRRALAPGTARDSKGRAT